MSTPKKITVLMSVYNTREEWLRLAVESILQQTFTGFEFLIILDAPTDDSAAIIAEYAERDDRIRVVANEQNLGLTQSLNKGIRLAAGSYIARMDTDDIAETDRLQKQLEYLETHGLDLVGARVNRIDQDGNDIGTTTTPVNDQDIYGILDHANCIPHPTWFLRRNVYINLGGYRDIRACEDYDFLLRARGKKVRFGLCDDVLLNYRINLSGITRTNSLRQFLTTDYLQRHHAQLDAVNQSTIDAWLENRVNEKTEKRFEAALSMTRESIACIKNRQYLRAIRLSVRALATSRYALVNYWKMIRIRAL